MTKALNHFPPSAADAHRRLQAFVPKAGSTYAGRRNFDFGPGAHDCVSTLSPYLRLRLLDEVSVTRAVLAQHSAAQADKFVSEVFWRTYWKGWMEQRPGVWLQYLNDLNRLKDDVQTQSGLRARWEQACLGQTGIAAFDAWAKELAETGYMHNHARMWFASIWLFTLELPWQLGADFFLRHLLDGDAAVNTLSWRWVAGIQTKGKTYLARPDNIAKFTNGRFKDLRGLATYAPPLDAPEPPAPVDLPKCGSKPLSARYGLLIHGDDVDTGPLLAEAPAPQAAAYADATAGHSPWQMAPHVGAFRMAAAQDRLATLPNSPSTTPALDSAQAIAEWAARHDLDQVIAPYAPVGPMADMLRSYQTLPDAAPLYLIRRPLDTAAWPLARKGFFPFRKNIPDLIARFVHDDAQAQSWDQLALDFDA